MVTMAIDASSKATGIAIFKDKELIFYDCIYATDTDPFTRIKKMTEKIKELHYSWGVSQVVMEDVLPEEVGHNQQVFKILHYLQAYIVLNLHDKGQNVSFLTASEWRKICGIQTGRGITRETLKRKDIQFVKWQYSITVNDDIADAIGLGYAYLNKDNPIKVKKEEKQLSAF